MSVDGAAAGISTDAGVALIVALGIERACFDRHAPAASHAAMVSVLQCGPGAARAEAAAERAVSRGTSALACCGLAGGLEDGVGTGSVLLPRRIVRAGGEYFSADPSWRDRLERALAERHVVDDRPLLSSAGVLVTPAAKRRAAEETGAVAVDMESAAVAAVASRAGVPFVALRVIADAVADALPAGVERWIDETGERKLAPVVDAALRPASWPLLWTLGRRWRRARQVLIEVAAELTPRGFLFEA